MKSKLATIGIGMAAGLIAFAFSAFARASVEAGKGTIVQQAPAEATADNQTPRRATAHASGSIG